jgi:hypothetical protein
MRPVFPCRRQFLGRPTRHRAPARFPTEFGRFSPPPPPPPISLAVDPPRAVYRLSQPITAGFCHADADFLPPGPASPPLSTGLNGERRIHCSAELGRPNTIYMSSWPSGPIFMFLIQFEFYRTKQLRFHKISPPMFLEFDLVFLHIFFIFKKFRI